MREVTQNELKELNELLVKHNIGDLIAQYKPENLQVSFNAQWLDHEALAASFPRMNTAEPHFITLSPKLLEWGFRDRIAFSTIILHELAHVIDRSKNWITYGSKDHAGQSESREYEADELVVSWGLKFDLIETLKRTIDRYQEQEISTDMMDKRLRRLLTATRVEENKSI